MNNIAIPDPLNTASSHLTMHELPPQEKPYERLYALGPERLSDGELIAILLQSGVEGGTSLDLARQILSEAGPGGLLRLSRYSQEQLMEFKGVGKVKAARILSSFELGRRLRSRTPEQLPTFDTPEKVFDYFAGDLGLQEHEELRALLLTTRQTLIRELRFGEGSLNGVATEMREIVRQALINNAAGMIMVHNHPSGDPSPSTQDKISTSRLRQALESVGINLVDHIIVTHQHFYSFRRDTSLLDGACEFTEAC